jgi:BASS family bile acid:Na+ symporter
MDQLQEMARAALPTVIALFMVGNLAAIGLELDARSALAPLRDLRFVGLIMLWDWLLCPGIAWLLARIVPMAEPYGLGLVLIGMAPAAPFLPMMVRRARGDLPSTAAFMLMGALGTVVFMPLALPILAPGLSITAWSIARPLLLLLMVPLMTGLAVRTVAPSLAERLRLPARLLGNLATLALLVIVIVLYKEGFVGAVGSYAIATQFFYAFVTTAGAYALGAGLRSGQRSVLCLGVCTRNLGAAVAPLLAANHDPRTMVMLALGVPVTLLVTFIAARWFESQQNSTLDVASGRSR